MLAAKARLLDCRHVKYAATPFFARRGAVAAPAGGMASAFVRVRQIPAPPRGFALQRRYARTQMKCSPRPCRDGGACRRLFFFFRDAARAVDCMSMLLRHGLRFCPASPLALRRFAASRAMRCARGGGGARR